MNSARSGFVKSALILVAAGSLFSSVARAGDLRISLPKRGYSTPVQRLNRDGVEAINKHDIDKAKKLFYEAYLLDPDDPFTLNNLGYVAELEGSIDRAQKFYSLARARTYDVRVDRSSRPELRGQTFAEAAGAGDQGMQINRSNLEAMRLLQQDRVFEAEDELAVALKLEPNNPFTLNNLGLVKEKEGDLRGALESYNAAAALRSSEPVIVTTDKKARGRGISEVAKANARRIEERMAEVETPQSEAARLTFLGVKSVNHNNLDSARRYFQQALQLDPENAFVLNNMGFLSEIEGDQETADLYYGRAQSAPGAHDKVTAATQLDVVGMRLTQLADSNDSKVDEMITSEQAARRRRGGPIQLKHRDNTPVIEPK